MWQVNSFIILSRDTRVPLLDLLMFHPSFSKRNKYTFLPIDRAEIMRAIPSRCNKVLERLKMFFGGVEVQKPNSRLWMKLLWWVAKRISRESIMQFENIFGGCCFGQQSVDVLHWLAKCYSKNRGSAFPVRISLERSCALRWKQREAPIIS